MKTSNASIKAIIFTIILFLFIILVSLFKGIYLYNIKIKNIHIKSLFLKIDNKIVLKLNNVNIQETKNYSKDIINLHKTILTATKILNIFEKITINNLSYGNYKIKTIKLIKNKLFINSDILTLQGVINANIKNSFINLSYLKIPKYNIYLKNILLNLNFKKNEILIKGNFFYSNNKVTLNAALKKNNIINFTINAPKIDYINILTLKNLKINGKINLHYYLLTLNSDISKAKIHFNNISADLSKINLNINNRYIKGKIKKARIEKLLKFKNTVLNDIGIYYALKNDFSILNINEIITLLDNYKLQSYKNELLFKNKNNYNFTAKNIKIFNPVYGNLSFKNILLNNFNKNIFYTAETSVLNSKYAKLQSSEILGKLFDIKTDKIKGEVLGIDSEFYKINVNIKNKTAEISKAVINGININDIKYKNNKLTLKSNALFDEKIKKLIYKFLKIKIPLTQVGGTNEINSTVYLNENFKSFTQVITDTALFKLFDFDLFVKKGDINITNRSLNFYAKEAKLFLSKTLPLTFSGNGSINYENQQLSLKGLIDFEINNIIKLHDFHEKAVVDFKEKTLKTENSHVYIDFTHSSLIINQLKNILSFTPFEKIVKNGLLLITFNKKSTVVTSYLLLKLPLLYTHNNNPVNNKNINVIKKIFLYLSLKGNDIKIYNKNVFIDIKNNAINAKIENMDINLFPLEKLLYKTENNEFNYSVKINSLNSNLIYKTHKFLSQTATLTYNKNNIKFKTFYKKSSVTGYTKQQYLLLEGKNFSNEEFRAFLPKFDFFSKINLDFIMVKSPDDFYTGKIYINSAIVKELKSLNNIIAFINTVPSVLSLSSPGFSSKGYKIRKGFINYLLYKKILYIKDAKIYGDNLDFIAKGYIDFNKNYIFLKVKANLKMKLKKIPIIGKGLSYLLFGKDGSIDIKLVVKGDLNNPEVKEDIGKDILLSPFKLFKRAITLPFNLF